ncbi:MAG: glycosyltransferase family 4 protein [Candidatus Omnitrophica bacterium]|nr:glycosyltransferase family 4 protein [Candidatus Omnitrophota bacterium]
MVKIKAAHIITKLELGGAQQNTLYTVEHLDKDKFDVTLICGSGGLLDEESDKKGVRVIFIPSLKARRIIPWFDIIAFLKLWRICKKERFTIVHTHSSKAGILGRWAARLAGVPVLIHTVHGWGFNDYQNPLLKRFYTWLERLTAKITTRLIAVSYKDVEKGLEEKIGRQEQYKIIRSGIEIEKFRHVHIDVSSKRKELGLEPGRPVIGMVACLKPQKAPIDFVRVANEVRKKIPEAQFILVGDGILRARVERLKDKLGLDGNLVFTGWRRDIPEIMASIDVLCLTSLWEGLPRTILEAVSCGIPVVATDVGGNSEVIKDGYLIKPGDISRMAEKVERLINQPATRTDKRTPALDSSFDIKEMVKNIESLYEKVIYDSHGKS